MAGNYGLTSLHFAAQKGWRVLPSAAELYLDTHFRERPGEGRVPVSSKAKSVKERYDRNVAECQSQSIQKDLNQIFFETVDGRKKGKVPGLGADLYFDRPTFHAISAITAFGGIRARKRGLGEIESRAGERERESSCRERDSIWRDSDWTWSASAPRSTKRINARPRST